MKQFLTMIGCVMPLGLAVAACETPEPATPASGEGVDQVTAGQALYTANCASCHGSSGQGTKDGPAVVGKSALPLDPPSTAQARKTKFRTAKDVLDFVKAAMPKDNPGSLSEAEYAAILAFALKANGIDVRPNTLDANTAAALILHP